MLALKANTTDLEVVTSAAADIEYHVSLMQASNAAPPVVQDLPSPPGGSITSATTTQIVDTSGLTNNHNVNVKHINLRNNHASTSCDVTVQINRNGTVETLFKCTLLAGEACVLTQHGVWIHYDVNGGVYPSVGNAASQAEMEAGTATDKYVTPQGVNWHPGVNKFWVVFTGNSTTILASWNMTSISDGTTEATVTIATDFSSTNWCCQATAEGTTTTSVANARLASCRSIAAGSIVVYCTDAAATPALQDPTRWHVTGLGDQ